MAFLDTARVIELHSQLFKLLDFGLEVESLHLLEEGASLEIKGFELVRDGDPVAQPA